MRRAPRPPTRRGEGSAVIRAASESDPLVVRHLEFLGGMSEHGGWRPATTLPEIAFVGRSNVGKSSLLNTLVRRRALARVSRTPGRTRAINFFQVNNAFVLVDLPGYGYARVAKAQRATWRPLLESYLRTSPELRGIVLLLDARRDPTGDDRAMLDFLSDTGIPTIVAITKMDKFGQQAGAGRVAKLTAELGLDDDQVVPVSAQTGAGREELAAAVVSLLDAPGRPIPS